MSHQRWRCCCQRLFPLQTCFKSPPVLAFSIRQQKHNPNYSSWIWHMCCMLFMNQLNLYIIPHIFWKDSRRLSALHCTLCDITKDRFQQFCNLEWSYVSKNECVSETWHSGSNRCTLIVFQVIVWVKDELWPASTIQPLCSGLPGSGLPTTGLPTAGLPPAS